MSTRRLRIDLKRVLAKSAILSSGCGPLREQVLRDLEERGFVYGGDGWWGGDPALLKADEVLEVEKEPQQDGTS